MPKINKRVVDGLRPSEDGRESFIWDSELRGFGVRMKATGRASYLIQYRTPEGQTRRLTLGKVGTLTPDEARTVARQRLVDVAGGSDPSKERHMARTAMTVSELCDEYMKAAQAGLVMTRFRQPKRSSTIKVDVGRIARHIKPLLGHYVAQKLTRHIVQRMADDVTRGKTSGKFRTKPRGKAVVTGGAGSASRVVSLLGGIWTWAERRGFVDGRNPARGVETSASKPRDRVLNRTELLALGKVLVASAIDFPAATSVVRLIALTGLRRQEACNLKWREIDESGRCLRLSETKTGRSTRPLGEVAFQFLRSLETNESEWVFPSASAKTSADLKKQITNLFDAAGLRDARSHDLRRTFASTAADLGYGDATIAELLGHSQRGVTARHYIRRPDEAIVAAATKTAAQVASALAGTSAEIVPLRRIDAATES